MYSRSVHPQSMPVGCYKYPRGPKSNWKGCPKNGRPYTNLAAVCVSCLLNALGVHHQVQVCTNFWKSDLRVENKRTQTSLPNGHTFLEMEKQQPIYCLGEKTSLLIWSFFFCSWSWFCKDVMVVFLNYLVKVYQTYEGINYGILVGSTEGKSWRI